MNRDEINMEYALLASEHHLWYVPPSNGKHLELTQNLEFLHEMLPLIEAHTEDSRPILESIISRSSEETIRWILEAKEALGGVTYYEAKSFVLSFSQYIGKGLIRKPKRVQADPQKMRALYQVTKALWDSSDSAYPSAKGIPVDKTQVGDHYVYFITDKVLIDFILEHSEHADAIAGAIGASVRQGTSVHYPSLDHIINGGTKAVSQGAL